MAETISTSSYERRVRISTTNGDMGETSELHARITSKAVTLTRVSTARKPKSFWISEEEINMLVAAQTAYLYWLKQRESTLKEAKALVGNDKISQPGDVNFREEYHDDRVEQYQVYTVGGWDAHNTRHDEESIHEHVALEHLIDAIMDALPIKAAQEQSVQGQTEGLEPLEIKEDRDFTEHLYLADE